MTAPTSAERSALHRAGRNYSTDRRISLAAKNPMISANEACSIHRSPLPTIAGAATTADKAYWVYVGRTARPITAAKVKFQVTTGGTGAQTAEIAIATSGDGPNAAAQTLTVVAASGTLDDLTGTGVMGNTTSLAYQLSELTHVWIGFRENMASGRPQLYGHTFDASTGSILSTATAGVLTVGTSYTGALITAAVTWQAPALFLSEV